MDLHLPQSGQAFSIKSFENHCRKISREDITIKCYTQVYARNSLEAVAEAPEEWDVSVIRNMKWQGMTFNAFEPGSVEAVRNAFDVLSDGGAVIEEIHELPWSNAAPLS